MGTGWWVLSKTWDWMEWNAMTTRAPVVPNIANICVKIFKAQTSSIMKVRRYDKVAAYYMNVASVLRIKLENFSENISSSPSARLINILFCLRWIPWGLAQGSKPGDKGFVNFWEKKNYEWVLLQNVQATVNQIFETLAKTNCIAIAGNVLRFRNSWLLVLDHLSFRGCSNI